MAARVPPPTPEEIALRAREIRLQWSPNERERRCAYKTKVVYVPVPDSYFAEPTPAHPVFSPARRLMTND